MIAILNIYGSISEEKYYDTDVTPTEVKAFLEELNPYEPLDIHINSYGGHVSAGLAIYNILKAHKGPTTSYIDGFACSISSVIPFAADEVIIPENAVLMVHLPLVMAMGNKIDFQQIISTLETMEKTLLSVYTANAQPGISEEAIKTLLHPETWLTGDEAAEYFTVTVIGAESVADQAIQQAVVADAKDDYTKTILQKFAASHISKHPQKQASVLSKFQKSSNSGSVLQNMKASSKPTNLLTKFKKAGN
ncbi:head maturation protease, ClpP-related [Sporosarcina cascadiensis]|uniref:head maturation protease, ClpP-related n=1 Tax=Sporosarcina cascadiensis TaxID=2660747 RepID=UPI00129A7B51|nr:head maturation protease, ClpP-related [Sporosarcina cascadiensis]